VGSLERGEVVKSFPCRPDAGHVQVTRDMRTVLWRCVAAPTADVGLPADRATVNTSLHWT
jgi:hypothetical protein